VPAAILTKSGQVLVNAAKQSSHRAATSVSAARRVNTAASRPNVNNTLLTTYSYFKAHLQGNPQYALQDQVIFDSGCSRHMTGNKSYLTDYQEIDGGFVAFGGNAKGGKITRKGGLTCVFAKATLDESNLWHRRLGYINFKTMNKLVRGNLVRGLPLKLFENDHTCVACQKGK
nr:ribonuclease H-like domain-containing protein [Tanacetum cinerariifolium]